MTDPDLPEYGKPARKKRDMPVMLLLVLAVAMLLVSGLILYAVASQREDRAQAAAGQARTLAEVAAPVCERGTQDADLLAVCAKAAEVKAAPAAAAPAAQVDYERVRAVVASAVAADPRLQPTSLVGLVRSVYEANRPADGKTPTDEQLLALIQRVFAEHPPKDGAPGQSGIPGKDGADGKAGADGRPGVDGKAGAQGVSVQSMRFARDDTGTCQLLVTLVDPATGKTLVTSAAVPEQLCAPAPGPAPLLGR